MAAGAVGPRRGYRLPVGVERDGDLRSLCCRCAGLMRSAAAMVIGIGVGYKGQDRERVEKIVKREVNVRG